MSERVSSRVIDLVEASISKGTAEAVGLGYFDSLKAFGAMAINVRAYRTVDPDLKEHVFCRTAPPSFMPVYSDWRFYEYNPLPHEARRRIDPFVWSDILWRGQGPVWVRETMRDCRCPDGIIVPCHGPNNYLGVVSVAFERIEDIAPQDLAAIQLAGHVLHGRMLGLQKPPADPRLSMLTARERDCLRFVADGRSDGEIATAMRISRTTVATHIVNARQKLGAKTRAQAVAALLAASYPNG